jgi:predicted MFS family arabinose efflux permease/enamine deaminase RidA (YjgF/YER057c/UK114 family)
MAISTGQRAGSRSGSWPAVAAVTLGIFCLMTSELLPVGLLTPVSADLGVSNGTAGLMVTMPGLVAALSAPLIAVFGARLDRRLLLCALVALVGAANLVCALTPEFVVVLVARLLVGVGIGGFWATAGGLAGRLVPAAQVGRATTVIFGGVSAASVLGVPAGTFLSQVAGWRAAFAGIGVLALLAGVCIALAMPAVPGTRTGALTDLVRVFRGSAGVRMGLLVTFLLVTGQFTAYTFVRPVLQDVSGLDGSLISPLLLAYGVAGVAGNFLVGGQASRHLHRTLIIVAWRHRRRADADRPHHRRAGRSDRSARGMGPRVWGRVGVPADLDAHRGSARHRRGDLTVRRRVQPVHRIRGRDRCPRRRRDRRRGRPLGRRPARSPRRGGGGEFGQNHTQHHREELIMSLTIINPAALHDPVGFGYSHVASVAAADFVLIGGQYGSGPDGHVTSIEFAEQVERSFANLGTALAAAGLDYGHVARLGTYIVDHDQAKLEALLQVIKRIWGDRPPAQTLIGVAALALPDMLFEVDAVAVRP